PLPSPAPATPPIYTLSLHDALPICYVHPETDAQVEAIDKILHLRKGSRILDVACGSGRHTVGLAKRGYRMTGFDLSRALLAEAQDRKSTRLNSSHVAISYAVFFLKK